jgi:hypothetical protein
MVYPSMFVGWSALFAADVTESITTEGVTSTQGGPIGATAYELTKLTVIIVAKAVGLWLSLGCGLRDLCYCHAARTHKCYLIVFDCTTRFLFVCHLHLVSFVCTSSAFVCLCSLFVCVSISPFGLGDVHNCLLCVPCGFVLTLCTFNKH